MRCLFTCALLVFLGCSKSTPTEPVKVQDDSSTDRKQHERHEARERLVKFADQLRQAMLKEEHQKVADLTLPIVIEKLGGHERFLKQLESVAADIKEIGIR